MDKELQFLIYNTPEENVSVNAVIKDETIWLTQRAMAELFDVGVPAISKHLANIYAEGAVSYTHLLCVDYEARNIGNKTEFGQQASKWRCRKVGRL